MHRINHIYLINKGLFIILAVMSFSSQISADEALGSAIDCTDMKINYIDRPDMTNSERLEAMDRAFFESVNRFEFCNLSSQSSSSSESVSSANQAPNSGSEAAITGSEAAITGSEAAITGSEAAMGGTEISEADLDSVADSLMTGTEVESTLPSSDTHEDSGMPEDPYENAGDEAVAIYGSSGASGALPEDIPDANNDDVVAAQIRLAAEIEKDSVKKEKLWNEYRKYKGLPVKY